MTKSDSKQRIRQVAIVLSCVDASAKQKLLGQLPTDQARLVRQEIARLGEIDPREREQAMKAFQSRSQDSDQTTPSSIDHPAYQSPNGRSNRGNNRANSRWPVADDDSANSGLSDFDTKNPAVELLDDVYNGVQDEFHDGYSNNRYPGARQNGFEPLSSQASESFMTRARLDDFPTSSGAEIAKLIVDERPTVIATVIKQVSSELGSAILAALPSRVAALALSTIPNLDHVDETILKDIQQSLHEKLAAYRGQISPDAPSVQHIQSLLRNVPETQRRILEQDLLRENGSLARSLGISLYANSLRSEPIAIPFTTDVPKTKSKTEDDTTVETELNSKDKSLLTFEDLEDLSPESLATVFRESNPNTILIAVTGAAIQLRTRLESMIDPSNVNRLRARIQSLSNIDSEARAAAREELTLRANHLWTTGKISAPKVVYQSAAA